MQIFETIQKNLNAIGFSANHSLINNHHVRGALAFSSLILLLVAYIFRVANSPEEYMNSMFMIESAIGISTSYFTSIFKKTELHDFIDNIQAIANRSKLTVNQLN